MRRQAKGNFLQWLRTFIEVAETRNIHDAAIARCISPSAVSLHIRKLEEDLGFQLFLRKNNGMSLTQLGRQFQATSLPALQSIDNLRSSVEMRPVLRGPVRLASLNRLTHHFVPAILRFKKLHPEVSFSIQLSSGNDVWRNLESGVCDLALTIYRRLPGHLSFKALRPSSAFLYTPPGNPYRLPAKPSWDEICELPFVSLTLEGYVNPVIAVVPEIRQPHNVVLAVDDFMLAMKLVKGGLGVCIAPPLTQLESAADYSMFNIDHIFPIGTFGIGSRRNAYIMPQAKAFMDFLVEQYTSAKDDTAQPESWEVLSDVHGLLKARQST